MNKTVTLEKNEMLQLITRVSPNEFVDFLNRISPGNKCGFCLEGEYGVSSSPDGRHTALVVSPVPTSPGVGLWSFIASCQRCGHIAMFDAARVSKLVRGE